MILNWRVVLWIVLAGWGSGIAAVSAAAAPKEAVAPAGAVLGLAAQPPPASVLADAHKELADVLKQPVYARFSSLKPSLVRRLAELVARYVFRPLFTSGAEPLRRVIFVACLVLLGLLIGHMIWEITAVFTVQGRAGRAVAPRLREVHLLRLLSGEALLQEGDRVRADGRPPQAIGFYYLALISWLASAGCTQLDRTLTNWEHYRLAEESARLSSEGLKRMRQVNFFFDDYCYGALAISDGLADEFRQKVLELREVARASPA